MTSKLEITPEAEKDIVTIADNARIQIAPTAHAKFVFLKTAICPTWAPLGHNQNDC